MTPTKFKEQTSVLGAPKNWNENERGPCLGLPVAQYAGQTLSRWKMSFKERVLAFLGFPVWLCVSTGTDTQPPVWLQVAKTGFAGVSPNTSSRSTGNDAK